MAKRRRDSVATNVPLDPEMTPILAHDQEYHFSEDVDWARFFVDYEYRLTGVMGPDLGLSCYCYDDRVSRSNNTAAARGSSRTRSSQLLFQQ